MEATARNPMDSCALLHEQGGGIIAMHINNLTDLTRRSHGCETCSPTSPVAPAPLDKPAGRDRSTACRGAYEFQFTLSTGKRPMRGVPARPEHALHDANFRGKDDALHDCATTRSAVRHPSRLRADVMEACQDLAREILDRRPRPRTRAMCSCVGLGSTPNPCGSTTVLQKAYPRPRGAGYRFAIDAGDPGCSRSSRTRGCATPPTRSANEVLKPRRRSRAAARARGLKCKRILPNANEDVRKS